MLKYQLFDLAAEVEVARLACVLGDLAKWVQVCLESNSKRPLDDINHFLAGWSFQFAHREANQEAHNLAEWAR